MKNKIKEIREDRGMTQGSLASTSGVSRTVISQLENGSRPVVTSETMLKISKALDKPIEEIFAIKVYCIKHNFNLYIDKPLSLKLIRKPLLS